MDSERTSDTGISVHAGFPNAADDARLQGLNLNTLLVPRPNSTYHFKIIGDQWEQDGIFNGDIALVDRSLTPHRNDIVIWWKNDTFMLSLLHRVPSHAIVWGVVTTTIRQIRGGE